MSQQSAAGQMDFATEVARRLPATFAALGAGRIHPVHLRIIEEETRYPVRRGRRQGRRRPGRRGPRHDVRGAALAARKLVLKLDPDADRKRKEAAQREAHVRRFREESGNAGMVARELPCDEVLASWQHVEQRALDLRAAGMPGTLQDLRVRAYLDLLQERDSRTVPAGPPPAGAAGPARPGPPPRTSRPRQPPPAPAARPGPSPAPGPRPGGPGWRPAVARRPRRRRPGRSGPAPRPGPRRARAWPPWSPSPSP